MDDDLKTKIDSQKTFYKNGKGSLCLKCKGYENDCFEAIKVTGSSKEKDYKFSIITRCGSFDEIRDSNKK